MDSGILGSVAPTADTNTKVYEVPTGTQATVIISIVNRGVSKAVVQMAVSTTSTPTNSEYIEFGTELGFCGVLERTGVVMQAGKKLVVKCSTANCSVNVYGFEEEI